MLTLIALSAVLIQAAPPPSPRDIVTHVRVMGSDGPGSLDRNADGQITREEFAAPMNDHFSRMDRDGDGQLSPEELSAGHGPNGDGDVIVFHRRDGGEPASRRFEIHRSGDAGDGGREGHEIVVHAPGGHGGPMVIHGPVRGAADGESRFEIRHMTGSAGQPDMDLDSDGRISEAEFTRPLRDAFARMDADRSGFLEDGERGDGHGVQVFTRRLDLREGDEE